MQFHYLRDLLVSPAHENPDITTFLLLWVFEELWYGEALEMARRIDRRVDRLPGLDGLHLVEGSVTRARPDGGREPMAA